MTEFKAWHKKFKKMYWFDVTWGNYSRGNGFIGMVEFGEERRTSIFGRGNVILIDPNECELMQFTGLYDDSEPKKKIFERDIIPYEYSDGTIINEEIIFEDGCFWIGDIAVIDLKINNGILSGLKVVGNAYQNPELLNAK